MIKLLRGDFIRLFKSKIFWTGTIFMFVFSGFAVWSKWRDTYIFPDNYYEYHSEALLIAGANYIGIVIPIVVAIFIGTDYSNGTIRNKYVMGHSRVSVYLSNLIVCITSSAVILTAYMAVVIGASGMGIIKKFEMSSGGVTALCVTTFLAEAALTAIFLFICMLVPGRTAGSVITLILSVVLLSTASTIYYKLAEDEYIERDTYVSLDEEGKPVGTKREMTKNPFYLEGAPRKIYGFLNDLLPYNQFFQLGNDGEMSDHMAYFPLYSFSLIVVTTGMGILIYRKRNLK